jgi:small subunit ribosomal protein S6
MQQCYETLMLVSSHTTDDEIAGLEKALKSELKSAKGTFSSFDKWGKYRLAYPVRKQEYGMYVLARYQVESTSPFFKSFEHHLRVKCNEFVMRHVNVHLDDDKFKADYIKPEPLDTQANVDNFVKNNKMGLLKTESRPAAEAKPAAEAADVVTEENAAEETEG